MLMTPPPSPMPNFMNRQNAPVFGASGAQTQPFGGAGTTNVNPMVQALNNRMPPGGNTLGPQMMHDPGPSPGIGGVMMQDPGPGIGGVMMHDPGPATGGVMSGPTGPLPGMLNTPPPMMPTPRMVPPITMPLH